VDTDLLLIALGTGIVLVVLYDVAATTISLSAVRGPFSGRLSSMVWTLGNRPGRRRLQRATGPLLIVSILIGWLLALTAGWTLIFTADGALRSAAEPQQQSSQVRWVDALFFVFGRLVGAGSTNLEPDEAGWSTAVALLTLSGVILLTLVIAWILPVVAAVVQKRSLASKLSALGGTPEGIIARSWTGRDLGDLNLHLLPLIGELTILAQRHLAYPAIHYFHSSAVRTALGARIAALDEALTLISVTRLDDVERGTGLDVSVTRPLRQAISDYLSTLEYVFIEPADEVPGPPRYQRLVELGIIDGEGLDDALSERNAELETRRALLHGYVLHDGWTWSAVCDDIDAQEEDPERAR
jgi:hypothetical protein